jgi:hypothetical protein
MGAQGTATLDFGAFPGTPQASIAVTGQTGILSTSLVEAWIFPPGGTVDHSEDEHIVENFSVIAAKIVAGTGFTIFGESLPPSINIYGTWKIAWCWN